MREGEDEEEEEEEEIQPASQLWHATLAEHASSPEGGKQLSA